ncbi:MAG TPA: chloride channel protein [Acidimicrobiales bacterium]
MTVSDRWKRRRVDLSDIALPSRNVLLLSAIVGTITGVLVAGFEAVVLDVMLDPLLDMPLWVGAVAPTLGLVGATAALHWIGRGIPGGTTDEYIKSFHDPLHRATVRETIARMVAAISTLGAGGAMGMEGPSIFLGGAVGTQIDDLVPGRFRGERRTLLVAGAAAGVAAIFKAPATGAVFALEVPYKNDLARHALAPALIGSATGYLAFAGIHGTDPLLPVRGQFGFNGRDIVGAILLGVLAGVGARAFALALRQAKTFSTHTSPVHRIALAGGALVVLFTLTRAVVGESLSIESGFAVMHWVLEPDRSIPTLLAVLLLRCAATVCVLAGGGVGGIFIPLVVAGALSGGIVGNAINELDTALFVVIGIAAFLGAGYRVPLASVMFVAETTGQASVVVPGLLAAVAAELVMGPSSVTDLQRPSRV